MGPHSWYLLMRRSWILTTTSKQFDSMYSYLIWRLLNQGMEVQVGEWQSTKVEHELQTFIELFRINLEYFNWDTKDELQWDIKPDLPWAEDHFQERISGIPHNPPPSERYWPWRDKTKDNEDFKEGKVFSHTYPERYWPSRAYMWVNDVHFGRMKWYPRGVRYDFGDFADVVNQLQENPLTRQAYLPVFFPEDTGNKNKVRVPCSLGYHFMVRGGRLHCDYYIRSCDLLRHFKNDLYMTARLQQYVLEHLQTFHKDIGIGTLMMHITSLHAFKGDRSRLLSIRSILEKRADYGSDEHIAYI